MGTGMPIVEAGIGAIAILSIAWWMIHLTTKSRPQRRPQVKPARIVHQPWDNDKTGGRGNR